VKFLQFADLHLRKEQPPCRLEEDWLDAQRRDIRFIVDFANKRKLPIYGLGDIFQWPRAATEVVNMAIREFRRAKYGVFFLPGNHDLIGHSYESIEECSLGILLKFFNEAETDESNGITARPFALDEPSELPVRFIHRLIFPNAESRPVEECGQIASELLSEFPNQKLICTGDYHHSFVYEESGRFVINTGCVNIQASDMVGYQPKICVVDTESLEFEWIDIPQNKVEATDQFKNEEKAQAEMLRTFIENMPKRQGVTLSFGDDLERAATEIGGGVMMEYVELMQELKNEGK